MPGNEAEEILALTLIFVVHVAGGLMLVWGMFDRGTRARWYRRRRRGDDGPPEPPPGPRPSLPSRRRPLPLASSRPSDVRLRDETPLRDAHPRPPRRPSRPQPSRSPERR